MSSPNFKQSLASKADTGRACPYCRFPLKEGAQVAVCEICGAAHHTDCWHDNGGCAILACPGGPTKPGSRPPADAAYPPGPTEAHPQHAFAASPPPPLSAAERRGPSLAIAVFVLALAVGGAAVAILLSGRGTSNVRVANVTTAQTITSVASQQTPAVSTPQEVASTSTNTRGTLAPSTEGDLPNVSSEQMQQEIQEVLREWHEDVISGDYHGAWELLSARKRAQDKREEGYATWAKNQSTLRPYLNPANLQVTVESTDPNDGVAQVDVTGMGWDKPGASCTEWSGITWVKYENGAWRYDPGYSTTRQRELEWKPRFSELLGGSC